VRIIDEKIKVLYIEGMPRWEYRYLRWVLLRDPRIEVTFLMTKGDPELAKVSKRHIDAFPEVVKDALKYDLVILGDVPSTYFNTTQLQLMEKLVKTGGGSLLMIAGPMAAPHTYGQSPLKDVLPVEIAPGQWRPVGDEIHPILTEDGHDSPTMMLGGSRKDNEQIWSKVTHMNALPPLNGAKPGATVLLSLPKVADQLKDYPLVAWHRYGKGKCMFVATEDLWRLRFQVGNKHHASFWGQTIQFLTLSRLLGQNKQISIETNRKTYSAGEQVQVFANVLNESYEPISMPSYAVVLERRGAVDSAVEMELTPVTDTPGLFSGVHLAVEDGVYSLKARDADRETSNQVEFEVVTIPLEDRETAMKTDVVRQVAELSGGKTMSLSGMTALQDEFDEKEELTAVKRMEKDLWDAPLFFILLVIFTGIEWYMRRRDNLV